MKAEGNLNAGLDYIGLCLDSAARFRLLVSAIVLAEDVGVTEPTVSLDTGNMVKLTISRIERCLYVGGLSSLLGYGTAYR